MLIIGHKIQWKYLSNAVKEKSLGHAFIFSGPEGVGKKNLAYNLYLLANNKEDISPVDPGILSISPADSIGIDAIRNIQSFLSLKGEPNSRRFIVIDNSHLMTIEAANALLKTLEEPPAGVVLILITDMPGLMSQTILSRCQEVRFNLVSQDEFNKFISGIKPARLNYRSGGISKEDKEFLSKIAAGRPGYASRLIEGDILKDAQKSVNDLRKLMTQNMGERIIYAKKMAEKEDYQDVVKYWLDWIAASLKQSDKNAPILNNLLYLNNIIRQSQYNSRLALENFLLKI